MQNQNLTFPKNIEPLRVGDKVYQSILQYNLSSEDIEKARSELGETDEKRRLCLSRLKKILTDDTKLKSQMDDEFLLRFLRVSKCDVDKAYKRITEYYRLRKEYPRFFDISDITLEMLQNVFSKPLPFRDEEGRFVQLSRLGHWNVDEIPLEKTMSLILYIGDISTSNPANQVNGTVVIIDAEKITWHQLWQFLCPANFKALVSLFQGCYPWRNKKTIFINTNPVIRAAVAMFVPFLRKKMRDRVLFLGSDFEELYKYVSPDILPPELGGTLEEKHFQKVYQFQMDNMEYIKHCRTFGYAHS